MPKRRRRNVRTPFDDLNLTQRQKAAILKKLLHPKSTGGVVLLVLVALFCTAMLVMQSPMFEEWNKKLGLYEDTSPAVSAPVQGETQLHFIDVGQGDATLIAQGDEYALIDAGVAGAREDLIDYLDALGVQQLEVLVMTHAHADHIGAMAAVIDTFDVKTVILPDFDLLAEFPTSATFEGVMTALENSDATVVIAEVGQSYPVGEGLLTVVSKGVETDNANDVSVCTKFTAGEFSMLCTGDAEVPVEDDMLWSGIDVSATVYQAGHHGSTTSNSADFLDAVSPEIAVISCGIDNTYGHPHWEILELFEDLGLDIYRTDLQGDIVITHSTEAGVQVYTEKVADAA